MRRAGVEYSEMMTINSPEAMFIEGRSLHPVPSLPDKDGETMQTVTRLYFLAAVTIGSDFGAP